LVEEMEYDPGLIDYIVERRIAYLILSYLNDQGTVKAGGWVKVPDIVKEIGTNPHSSKFKNLSASVHHYCKNLHQRFEAIDRHESERPVYYKINEKGEAHFKRVKERLRASAKNISNLQKKTKRR
jgi:hypothetical protein